MAAKGYVLSDKLSAKYKELMEEKDKRWDELKAKTKEGEDEFNAWVAEIGDTFFPLIEEELDITVDTMKANFALNDEFYKLGIVVFVHDDEADMATEEEIEIVPMGKAIN